MTDIELIEKYIKKSFKRFSTRKEMELKNLFPEPENKGLKHIWKYGAADLIVYRKSIPICIFEPGGPHHFEKKQMKNDARKFKLAELNKCTCLHLMNNVFARLSNRSKHRLIGSLVYRKENKNERS